MAKRSSTRPKKARPGDTLRPAAPLPAPPERTVTPDDVSKRLRGLCKGWSDGVAAALSMPQKMYENSTDGTTLFSGDRESAALRVISAISSGSAVFPNDPVYAISVTERGGSTYFVLADMRRRIFVRERLSSLQDADGKSWMDVLEKIDAALSLAGSGRAKNEGLVAVFDGVLKAVKPVVPMGPPPAIRPL
ncbi:MAG: hypothetical protein AB1324_05595 [Candidatus Micrarchaeota archaeon]